MFDPRLIANFHIALEAVIANRLRSLLTALGIIFGVAAVIAMLAIGNGAQQEILEQIKLVGVNNIIIEPIVEQIEEEVDDSGAGPGVEKSKFSPGLRMLDIEAIQASVTGIQRISPEVIMDTYIVKSGIRRSAKLVGVTPEYFKAFGTARDTRHFEKPSFSAIIISSPFSTSTFSPMMAASTTPSRRYCGISPLRR